jgi:hypothetical protein
MLKAQLGQSLTVGTSSDAIYKQLLADKQKWLAGEYDWPFLEDRFDVTVPGQGRYIAFPTADVGGGAVSTAMNLERPYRAEVFWNNKWSELEYGIGAEEFNYLNSDQPGNIQDPIQRWRWAGDVKYDESYFEVWPMPSTSQTVRFTGQRIVGPLVEDTDTCDLDDQLLTLTVGAELSLRAKHADAQLKQSLATERLRAVRASYPGRPTGFVFGKGGEDRDRKRLVSIAVAGNH